MGALMKRSDVFDALLFRTRLATSNHNHNDAFYATLALRSVAHQLFGEFSAEYLVIDSYCCSSPPSSFVGPLPQVVQS